MSDKAENRPIATVAVERTFFNLDSDYDYAVPPALADRVRPGVAVEVPFGSGNRLRRGIVLQVFVGINPALKDIARVCDYGTVLDESQIRLARWMKNRYFCTTYECLLQMLPRGFGKIGVAGVRMAELTVSRGEELPRLTPKQQSVADLLQDIGSATVEEIKTLCCVGDGVLKNMEKCGVLRFFKKEKYRNPYAELPAAPKAAEIELSAEQTKAFHTLSAMLDGDGGSALLYGVTGSGKTQVYMRLIDRALQQGKDTIVLVPEIGLTPQVLGLFHQRYGRQVAVLHSGLSIGERNDEYRRADRGEAKIVLGTRSAVFAPLHALGLIIMDEEQELTYKSERTPRYHARDIARYRAGESGALFVMASATPSIESYAAAKAGKYTLLRRPEWPHPARPAHPALRRQPAAQRPDRGYAGRAGLGQPEGDQPCHGGRHPAQPRRGQADHSFDEPAGIQYVHCLQRLRPCDHLPQLLYFADLSQLFQPADVPLLRLFQAFGQYMPGMRQPRSAVQRVWHPAD